MTSPAELDSSISITLDKLRNFVKLDDRYAKLLRRPPFRFIHDICRAIHSQTSCLDELFSESEWNSHYVREVYGKRGKILWLKKLILCLGAISPQGILADPVAVVAGSDPECTNQLLQELCDYAADANVNWKQAVQYALQMTRQDSARLYGKDMSDSPGQITTKTASNESHATHTPESLRATNVNANKSEDTHQVAESQSKFRQVDHDDPSSDPSSVPTNISSSVNTQQLHASHATSSGGTQEFQSRAIQRPQSAAARIGQPSSGQDNILLRDKQKAFALLGLSTTSSNEHSPRRSSLLANNEIVRVSSASAFSRLGLDNGTHSPNERNRPASAARNVTRDNTRPRTPPRHKPRFVGYQEQSMHQRPDFSNQRPLSAVPRIHTDFILSQRPSTAAIPRKMTFGSSQTEHMLNMEHDSTLLTLLSRTHSENFSDQSKAMNIRTIDDLALASENGDVISILCRFGFPITLSSESSRNSNAPDAQTVATWLGYKNTFSYISTDRLCLKSTVLSMAITRLNDRSRATKAYQSQTACENLQNEGVDIVHKAHKFLQSIHETSRGLQSFTPLHYACSRGHVPAVEALLACGANVNARNEDNETPVHLAAQLESTHVLDLLLDQPSVDMNALTKNGETPFFVAAQEHNVEAIRILLQHGADPTIRDRFGDTASDACDSVFIQKTIEIFVDLYASPQRMCSMHLLENIGMMNLVYIMNLLNESDLARFSATCHRMRRINEYFNETIRHGQDIALKSRKSITEHNRLLSRRNSSSQIHPASQLSQMTTAAHPVKSTHVLLRTPSGSRSGLVFSGMK